MFQACFIHERYKTQKMKCSYALKLDHYWWKLPNFSTNKWILVGLPSVLSAKILMFAPPCGGVCSGVMIRNGGGDADNGTVRSTVNRPIRKFLVWWAPYLSFFLGPHSSSPKLWVMTHTFASMTLQTAHFSTYSYSAILLRPQGARVARFQPQSTADIESKFFSRKMWNIKIFLCKKVKIKTNIAFLSLPSQVRCMMVTYFITLFLMFVVLVIGGVLGYVFRDQVSQIF